MTELYPFVLVLVGFVLFPGAILGFIFFGGRKQQKRLEARVAELTPNRELAEATIGPNGSVELRTPMLSGAHKVWLDCDVRSNTNDWSARVSVHHCVSPSGSSYRDHAGDTELVREPPFTIGEDSEGVSTLGPVPVRRTGALVIPRGGSRHWIQLAALPDAPVGSELFVRVEVSGVKKAEQAAFRVFVGLSIA